MYLRELIILGILLVVAGVVLIAVNGKDRDR